MDTVIIDGSSQRFCQKVRFRTQLLAPAVDPALSTQVYGHPHLPQCSKFHDLAAFHGMNRTCTRSLEAQNVRRREARRKRQVWPATAWDAETIGPNQSQSVASELPARNFAS